MRATALQRFEDQRFDLLVIGGGIVGSGVAALAAQQGLSTALVEQHDFACGASSASSKLLHGGLRYVRMGHFWLVREALRERDLLASFVAPHLVQELDFILPAYADGPYGRPAIAAALGIYAALTLPRRSRGRIASARRVHRRVPVLNTDGLRGAGFYRDARTNDARLCLAAVRAAAATGAVVLNNTQATAIERAGDVTVVELMDVLGGSSVTAYARTVVNAAGAAVDAVRRLEDPAAGTSVMLSKGAHVVLEQPQGWPDLALAVPVDATRVSFVIPWEGRLLLGTTDEPFVASGSPTVDDREEQQILAEAAIALPSEFLRPERICFRFAGLRVLPIANGLTARAPREVTLSRGRYGMLSVAGGKLTTYRSIAVTVLEALRTDLGLHRLDVRPLPLPGATEVVPEVAMLRRTNADIDPQLLQHLVRIYGTFARDVLSYRSQRVDALEPLIDGAPDVIAQALYARDAEWAIDPEDVLRRRTTLAMRGFDSPELRLRLRDLLESPLATAARASGDHASTAGAVGRAMTMWGA